MTENVRALALLGVASIALACPAGEGPIETATDPSTGAGTDTGAAASTTNDEPTTTAGTTSATTADETADPAAGLVVEATPASPRSGSSTQLTATLDGEPAEVAWALVDGPATAALTQDGVLSLPMTAGAWTVRATLKSDPQVTDEAVVVADFRGGLAVAGWGNDRDGRWQYNGADADGQGADLVANSKNVFALIRHTAPPHAILVSLVEATGAAQPGFGQGGMREFVGPGQVRIDPRHLGLGPDRMYVSGNVVLDSVLAVADLESGLASGAFGLYDPGQRFGFPAADPTGVYIGLDDSGGTVGARHLLASGALDMGWAGGGVEFAVPAAWKTTWDPGKESMTLRDLAVDDGGRLLALVTSYDLDNTGRVGVLLCFDAGGDLDPAFGVGGAVVWGLDDEAGTSPVRMTLAEDGDIVVVGTHYGSWFARRFTGDGDPVDAWGEDSYVTHEYKRDIGMAAQTAGVDAAIMPGGYIVFLVHIMHTEISGLVRFTPEGEVDADFGDPEADGDGWSLVTGTTPFRLAAGLDGRVFSLGQYYYGDEMVTQDEVWITARHSY